MIILLNKQRLRFLYDLLNKFYCMRLTFVLLFYACISASS